MPTKKLSEHLASLKNAAAPAYDIVESVAVKTAKGSHERRVANKLDEELEAAGRALEFNKQRSKAGEVGGTKSRRTLSSAQAKMMAAERKTRAQKKG